MNDAKREAKALQLTFSTADAGRQFDIEVNGVKLEAITLAQQGGAQLYQRDVALPAALVAASNGKQVVRFVARAGSIAGGLYGLRLLR